MFSTRFALPVAALLLFAAVPTVIHSYFDTAVTDGRTARAIPERLNGVTGVATKRRASWGEDRIKSADWIERRYPGPREVKLFVGRSHDPKRLYHHPELAVDYGEGYVGETTIRLPQRADVPVHVLRNDQGRVALYALHYADGYIDNPILFQLKSSVQSLFSRRQAMTLFFVAEDLPEGAPVESSSAAALLLAAMEAFEKQTPTE
jgi:hypothetical protein